MISEKRDYDEKRGYIRMSVDCQLSLKEMTTGQTFTGHCVNLSGSGVCFQLEEEPTMGSQLEILITPELAVVPALNAVVEVVRVQTSPEGGFEVGTSIVEMRG